MLSGKLFQSVANCPWEETLLEVAMLQMWMVGYNVDGECAMCNESMWRADSVVEF